MQLISKQQLLKEYKLILNEYHIRLREGGSMKIWYENKYERFLEICNIFEQIGFDPHTCRKYHVMNLRQATRNKMK